MSHNTKKSKKFKVTETLIQLMITLWVVWASIALLVGCRNNAPDNDQKTHKLKNMRQANEVEIMDANGVIVTVRQPVERIIVEYMDNAELVRILNRTDKIVGVAGYDYIFDKCERQFPKLKKLPSVGYPWALDYEAVLGLNPDLLLTFTGETSDKKINLPGINIVFLGLYYPNLVNLEESKFLYGVRTLGEILNAEEKAGHFIQWYTNLVEKLNSKTATIDKALKPKVLISSYLPCNAAESSYCVSSSKDTISQASILAGGVNIVDFLPEIVRYAYRIPVEAEWIISQNPDIIILTAVDRIDQYGYETDDIIGLKEGLKEYKNRPEMMRINAVKNNKVYVFDGHLRNDASGGVVAAAYMAKIFHPEIFKDVDPEGIHREYLKMQNLEYDLDEHGIFVYPPLETDHDLMGIPDHYKGRTF